MFSLVRQSAVTRAAAQVATLGFGIVTVTQLLLAAGVLPIRMAWGGTQTRLTPALRLASIASALLLPGCAVVIRRRAGLEHGQRPGTVVRVLSWIITAFLSLNTLGNLLSPSREERMVFAPLSSTCAVACLLVSLADERDR